MLSSTMNPEVLDVMHGMVEKVFEKLLHLLVVQMRNVLLCLVFDLGRQAETYRRSAAIRVR